MERIGIAPTARLSLWLGGALGLLTVMTHHAPWAAGILAGTGWGVLSLWLWSHLLATIATLTPRSPGRVVVVSLVKFPVLYGGGYLALLILRGGGWFEPVGVFVGVSLPLIVMTLKAAGAVKGQGAYGG